ncbi:hypothetical protein [Phytomonospora endophytica]|uniref:Uncharacterized protein n=1 Tax=Phytomonospora endophytica TaxID=714109 RepID=A0A841FCZ1_9ACTN|nr:hypothetical protein [Phytomonospora endophytica]MBB6032873.1 hypothetical protein [Phytomonospora endophytica]GIG65099.1 hypothetical protein Pen01_13940 [Phytomonospora endophytica]
MLGPTAADGVIDVNIDALEEFMQIFEQLQALQTSAHGSVHSTKAAGLGQFEDAVTVATEHARLRTEHMARLKRLLAALKASERATAQVIVDYEESDNVAKTNMNSFLATLTPGPGVVGTGDAPGMIAGHGPKEA